MKTCLVVILAFALWLSAGRPTVEEAAQQLVDGTWQYLKSGEMVDDGRQAASFTARVMRWFAEVLGKQDGS